MALLISIPLCLPQRSSRHCLTAVRALGMRISHHHAGYSLPALPTPAVLLCSLLRVSDCSVVCRHSVLGSSNPPRIGRRVSCSRHCALLSYSSSPSLLSLRGHGDPFLAPSSLPESLAGSDLSLAAGAGPPLQAPGQVHFTVTLYCHLPPRCPLLFCLLLFLVTRLTEILQVCS